MEIQPQYLNDAQYYCLAMNPRDLIIAAGRGWGKGVVQAKRMLMSMQYMPRSAGGMVGPSVKRLLSNILPSAIQHWEKWGYKRDVHYVIGHKPPKNLHFEDPYITPQNYDNVVALYNGSIINLISQDRSGTSNSLSLDWLSIDEAKFIDFEQLKNETFQANRGQEMYFGKCHLHHGMTVTSDMPLTKAGSWFLKYQGDQDPELISLLEGLIYRKWEIEEAIKRDGKMWRRRELSEIDYLLSKVRKDTLLYKEYSSIENLQVLGESFIRQMKRDLPPLTFQTSVMCKRIGVATDGFYSCFKKSNEYTAPNVDYLDNLEYDTDKLHTPDSRWDADIDPNKPLVIGFDANTNINWVTVAQTGTMQEASHQRPCLRIVKSFYVKYERKLPELCDDLCEYFRYHKNKKFIFYYDNTFVGQNYALHTEDFHHYITYHLRSKGWFVDDVYIGQAMNHIEKQLLINRMLQGKAKYKVLFNSDNNQDLLISIKSAGVYNGKKDKRGEKLVETEEDKLEARTDGSDSADTVMIGVEKFPRAQGFNPVVSSFGR